uniref:Ribonuclease 3 n=1 Tax=Wuchereria bancrofti TaxID=6293 RepID=A0AAF5PTB3_WUCBA
MFSNPGLNLPRINLPQQAVLPVLAPEVSRFGCSSSSGTVNMLPTAGGQAARNVPPLIISHNTSANLSAMRPLLPVSNSSEQISDVHCRPSRNVVGCPKPLFSDIERYQWSSASAVERSQFVRTPGSRNSRSLPSLRDVSRVTVKQNLHAREVGVSDDTVCTLTSDCGISTTEPVDISDEDFNYVSNEEEHAEHKSNNWNTMKTRYRKRRREQSSSGESESEQGKDIPRWQKLTKEDFVDTILSDTDDEIDQVEQTVAMSGFYSRSIPEEKFYCINDVGDCCATEELKKLHKRFRLEIIEKIAKEKESQPKSDPPNILAFHDNCKCGHHSDTETESESCDSDDCVDDSDERSGNVSVDEQQTDSKDKITRVKMSESKKHSTVAKREVIRKRNHPAILHSDVCFNEIGQMNDGPECRCSWAAKKSGLRHNKYAGETVIEKCDLSSSNSHRLWHYILYTEPNPNTVVRRPTKINHRGRTYELEGFSVFFHKSLPSNFPQTPLSKWTSEYNIKFMEENIPTNFTIEDLELFHHYLFTDIMEMYDLKKYPLDNTDGCPYYHCMPRFVCNLPDGGKEILPMSIVMTYLIESYHCLVTESEAQVLKQDADAFRDFAENVRGSLVMNANKRPSTIRVDLIDRPDFLPNNSDTLFPLITHFGVRPSSHTYNSNAEYQKMSKEYLRMRKILAMKPRVSAEERGKLAQKASQLKALRNDSQLKRDFVMSVSSRNFYSTGLFPDIVQHGLLLILACAHVRFQWSLQVYEQERIHYVFKNRSLLELALTHPSYRTNYGTNSDHARNTLNNCGVRSSKQRVHDRLVQQQLSAKKRGFHTLMEIMSKLGSKKAEQSPLNHNERLEFLGDAVIEFITTIHLFYMFSELDEGGLATYRSTMVQNKNLALLAKKIGLDEFMLYAHGPDLCHESDLRHAMANAFEAMMAAIYLDAGIDECDRIFGHAMFADSKELLSTWFDLEDHPLKRDNPNGDRHLINGVPALQLLTELEKNIGITFKHIRVLAKAFTRRNIGFNNLTLGHNQRLEFLGDTVLQLITTDYLYKHFPYHHEGHLSILRTCLVSNRTQSVICDDIGMTKYLVTPKVMQKSGLPVLRVKDKADLVEAFLGALYVDRGFDYCKIFCRICFFPRLKFFIIAQHWNDPKSQLQQCCLTLRQMDGGEPDIPEYRTIAVEGPTNTRIYKVAVYFRKKRLAVGCGHTMQLAQMRAAENALIKRSDLFPTLKNTAKHSTMQNRRENGLGAKMKCELADRTKQRMLFDSTHVSQSDFATGSSLTDGTQTSRPHIISLLDLKFDADGCLI